ncbi:MAG: transcription antitermination factor NusB [Gammaproteobacteria bacterium]|nr:transcription antitermination factor NusB [Gammaproteobacteria bacterium]MCD8541989.1 transcription antitermination factor NusB [Gammaproteobacteria bacterium]
MQTPPPFDIKARHNARKHLVQAIYEWQLTQEEYHEIERQFLNEFLGARVEIPYFQSVLREIILHSNNIDSAFLPYAARKLQDIDLVELAVLRLACFELLFRIDIPYQVVLNEALELTKVFGTQEGFRFVNGILDKVAQDSRQQEFKYYKKPL